MGKANWFWDSKVDRWVFRGKGGSPVAEFGSKVGLYGVAPVARQSHLADPTTASYGAVGSNTANVNTADLNNVVGSLTWMINQVGAGVASLNSALESIGILKTS